MRSVFFKMLMLIFFSFSLALQAQDLAALKSLNISKPEIAKTLKELNKMGKISDEQLSAALKELEAMSDKKMNELVVKGQQMGLEMAKKKGAEMELSKQLDQLKPKDKSE